jgi:predicted metal-dependent hydrolase
MIILRKRRALAMLSSMQLDLPLSHNAATSPGHSDAGVVLRGPRDDFDAKPPSSAEPGDRQFVFVRHRRARRYILRLDAEGRVRITIPRGGSRREALAFADRQREWIARERVRLTTRTSVTARPDVVARARVELPARLFELAAQYELSVVKVSIRDQRTRWGSCGRDGHICLNWRLLLMPDWVRDYVLVHELMHLRRMDHSQTYWKHVASACPRFRDARQWLRANGSALR